MKKTLYIILVVIVLAAGLFAFLKFFGNTGRVSATDAAAKEVYYCPMHPNYTSDRPGDCPICGMSLVKRETTRTKDVQAGGKKKILYYRNPMNPAITSPVPMKDEMGMDYVPVYEQQTSASQSGFYISSQKQQLIGVKKEKVAVRRLVGSISTIGTVAYDPGLFVAQQEYLQAFKAGKTAADSKFVYTVQQSDGLIETAKRKLLQIGMSEPEIKKLAEDGQPEQSLYLPEQNKVWVYLVVYEYEAGLVKENSEVEVEATGFPGESFKGTVISVAPILDPATRSLKVRCLVDNPGNKLKLQMYVNVKIGYDLGEKLAVPRDAVMHAGERDIVFTADPNGYFESRVVKLGAAVNGFYQVLSGLSPDEEVVTSGNFLIDSESKLNAVLSRAGEPNK